MRITREQYEAILARQATRRNQAGGATQAPKPQPPVCHEPVAEVGRKEGNPGGFSRRLVRITSYRVRLLDPDNLAGGAKYFLDCCKYAQLIRDDRPQDITLEVRQEKVSNPEDERTELAIIPIP